MNASAKYDVFLSYNTVDHAAAESIARALLPLLEPDMTEIDLLVEIKKQARYLASGDLHLYQAIERVLRENAGSGPGPQD